jgi:soluble cytochrome b562
METVCQVRRNRGSVDASLINRVLIQILPMKLRLFLTALLLALVASPLVRAEGTDLEKEMKSMGKAFKQLKKQASDAAQNTASLALVAQMQKAAANASALVPAKAADLPEKDRAAFTDSYKAKMKEFTAALAKLEEALKSGDNAAAAKLVAELASLQRADHKEFRKEND